MKEIRMCDLKSQYEKLKPEIDTALQEVFDTTAFVKGPQLRQFADGLSKYLGVKHVIPCANGTDALQVAMMALGLQPGDEVITSNFTFIATVEVIALLKLTPVLVDVDPLTFNLVPGEIEKAISPKTKAIVPVHLFGQAAPMEAIMKIAQKHNLYVIEDNAQALGTDYYFSDGTIKKAGTIGHIGTTSFFPTKNLGCYGDGGALMTNDDHLAHLMESIINHGMEVRYHHDRIGVNSRLDTLQAAILNVKLKNLDEYNRARQAAAIYYNTKFEPYKEMQVPYPADFTNHIYHQYTLVLKGIDRNALQKFLREKGIPSMIYYPVPLHLQKAFQLEWNKDMDYSVTCKLCENVISLPMHTEFDKEQLEYITSSVIEFINRSKAV